MMFDFDSIQRRQGSDSIKWHKYQERDIIPMWVADMDFISPPAVLEALHERVNHGIFGYGYQDTACHAAIVDHLWQTYQWAVEPHWIVWLPGLVCGLNVVCRSVGQTGDSVVTTVPVYPPFLSAPQFSNRDLITTQMIQSAGSWQMDWDNLESVITPPSSLFMLCNPHNPTGRVFTRDELNQLADICLRHHLVICSDEIHCDLLLEPGCTHIPTATLSPEIGQQTITLMAPSKTYNIPGLSCAFAIISNDSLRRKFKRAMAGIVPHVNVLGMVAAQAAYAKGGEWLAQLLVYLKKNRDLVYQTIRRTKGLQMANVEATYLAWIDAQSLQCSQPMVHFEKAGVGLSDGAEFHGPGFVRLNFGCSRHLLTKALKRMVSAVEDLST